MRKDGLLGGLMRLGLAGSTKLLWPVLDGGLSLSVGVMDRISERNVCFVQARRAVPVSGEIIDRNENG